jgi:hypothetical protein
MTHLFGVLGFGTGVFGSEEGRTADSSASLGMTKGRAALPFRFDHAEDEQQVPPLRYASVGMTPLFGCWDLIPEYSGRRRGALQIPRLRSG